jgi:regulator of sigma E protease
VDIVLFIIGLILFVGLVVVHELGHAIVAKRNGVEVEEFGIGFPPKAWGKKLKNGTLFTLNWLPLGGFVKLKGEHDAADGPGTYGGASLWAKTKILLAGVGMNWVTAVAIFTLLALIGMPKILPNQFNIASDNYVTVSDVLAINVGKDSPAQKAGIQAGDSIVSFAGQAVSSGDVFKKQTESHAGKTVEIVYKHSGQDVKKQVTLNADNKNGKGFIGIGTGDRASQRATWSAPIVGVGITVQFTYETFKGLAKVVGDMFQTKFAEAGANVAGPVGIISILKDSSTLGIASVLFLIGVISLTLAVMNFLPIPALDGGRLFVTLLYRALKKPLTKEREEAIQTFGFVALMLLVLLVTVVDVQRLF